MEQKKRFRFNAVDAVILILILIAAGVFVWRYAIRPGSPADTAKTTYPFTMKLGNTEIADDLFENGKIKVGDTLTDKATGAKIGTVAKIDKQESRSYASTSDGRLILTPRPLFSHLTLTVEGRGFRPKDGGLMVDGLLIYNNKEFEINIRDSAFWLRVWDFTLEDS
ncbi:MAG: DUF4330 domain-containing protein [Oscillospiraceae bacterium]|nr:DUF4330 domain-containing protein [Oscillospiraceae bacterium]